jgi:hypothetical protein
MENREYFFHKRNLMIEKNSDSKKDGNGSNDKENISENKKEEKKLLNSK